MSPEGAIELSPRFFPSFPFLELLKRWNKEALAVVQSSVSSSESPWKTTSPPSFQIVSHSSMCSERRDFQPVLRAWMAALIAVSFGSTKASVEAMPTLLRKLKRPEDGTLKENVWDAEEGEETLKNGWADAGRGTEFNVELVSFDKTEKAENS